MLSNLWEKLLQLQVNPKDVQKIMYKDYVMRSNRMISWEPLMKGLFVLIIQGKPFSRKHSIMLNRNQCTLAKGIWMRIDSVIMYQLSIRWKDYCKIHFSCNRMMSTNSIYPKEMYTVISLMAVCFQNIWLQLQSICPSICTRILVRNSIQSIVLNGAPKNIINKLCNICTFSQTLLIFIHYLDIINNLMV